MKNKEDLKCLITAICRSNLDNPSFGVTQILSMASITYPDLVKESQEKIDEYEKNLPSPYKEYDDCGNCTNLDPNQHNHTYCLANGKYVELKKARDCLQYQKK